MTYLVSHLKNLVRPVELSRYYDEEIQAIRVNDRAIRRPFKVKVRPRRISQILAKRTLDIALTLPALVVLSPIFLLVALIIKSTSKGPVFFVQERIGIGGRSFKMYKFRSMVVNAEELKKALSNENEKDGPIFKMKKDPRVTSIGRFIRRYSIDELPQLLNVLKGDMSLVGPRPPVPSEVAQYEAWQFERLSCLPGLTCIWQVSGRSDVSFEQWVRMDLDYIKTWNLGADVKLIFKTIGVVFSSRGAY